jgi:hypothetical protein
MFARVPAWLARAARRAPRDPGALVEGWPRKGGRNEIDPDFVRPAPPPPFRAFRDSQAT